MLAGAHHWLHRPIGLSEGRRFGAGSSTLAAESRCSDHLLRHGGQAPGGDAHCHYWHHAVHLLHHICTSSLLHYFVTYKMRASHETAQLREHTLLESEVSLLGMWCDCALLQCMKSGNCQALFVMQAQDQCQRCYVAAIHACRSKPKQVIGCNLVTKLMVASLMHMHCQPQEAGKADSVSAGGHAVARKRIPRQGARLGGFQCAHEPQDHSCL